MCVSWRERRELGGGHKRLQLMHLASGESSTNGEASIWSSRMRGLQLSPATNELEVKKSQQSADYFGLAIAQAMQKEQKHAESSSIGF